MDAWLKNALTAKIARLDQAATDALALALAGRKLLLSDSSNDLVEKWLNNHPLYSAADDLATALAASTTSVAWPGYTVRPDGSRQYGAAMRWVIWSPTEDLYWSNADGWTEIGGATRFTQAESQTLNLPLGGEWHQEEEG